MIVINLELSSVVGNFNDDSNLDIATANSSDDNISVLLGDGTGNFGMQTTFSVGDFPLSLTVGDFDNDGNSDLANTKLGVDRVKDYVDGLDKFLLRDRFGLGSLEFDDLTISQKGNNAEITITQNNQLLAIVENTNAAQLDSNDFVTV